jgi:integrase
MIDCRVLKIKMNSRGQREHSIGFNHIQSILCFAFETSKDAHARSHPCALRRDQGPQERIPSAQEEHELLQACRLVRSEFLEVMMVLALHTGMRPGELLSLKWSQVGAKGALQNRE